MSYYLKVLLRLLNILSKIFAVNEFNYDRGQNKMVSSRFWHWYMKILHCIFIWPLSVICIFLFAFHGMHELNLQLILLRLGVYIVVIRYIASGLIGWYFIYYRRDLCRLLNQFLRLAEMHREIFQCEVHVPWYILTVYFVREVYIMSRFSVTNLGSILVFLTGRLFFQFYLLDLGLMINLSMMRTLDKHIDRPSPTRKVQRSRCIEYFEQLIHLKLQLQQFSWISTTARLSVEIAYVITVCVIVYWTYFLTGNVRSLFEIFRGALLISNMAHNIWMARSIEAMERKVLNQMYQHDMLIPLIHQRSARRRRSAKLAQIYLKRCTRREHSPSIYNYIHVSRTLTVFIIDAVFNNAFLMIMFSLKYESRNEIFYEHHQPHTANDIKLKIIYNMDDFKTSPYTHLIRDRINQ